MRSDMVMKTFIYLVLLFWVPKFNILLYLKLEVDEKLKTNKKRLRTER